MINLVVIVISAVMLAFFLVWWLWPAFRLRTEAPKYSMLLQERRFNDQARCDCSGAMSRNVK